MLYKILRPLFFLLDGETSHDLALTLLRWIYCPALARRSLARQKKIPVRVMGIEFSNPVGLAAGLDKNGDYIHELLALGFGFIEIGGVTPKPQSGNPKPRLFRVPAAKALINRMGFNNKGVDHCVEQLKKRPEYGIIGVNLAKNKETPLEQAGNDYCICLEKIYNYADFATINISSPNTPGLRDLQLENYFRQLLEELKNKRDDLEKKNNKYLPLLVKISVDLPASQLENIVNLLIAFRFDGIITSNTTLDHTSVKDFPHGEEQGGVSGKPLFERVNSMVTRIRELSHEQLAIIGVGGIFDVDDAEKRIAAGADLLQIYTGMIYEGPGLARNIVREFRITPRI